MTPLDCRLSIFLFALTICHLSKADFFSPYGGSYSNDDTQYSVVAIPYSSYDSASSLFAPASSYQPLQASYAMNVDHPWAILNYGQGDNQLFNNGGDETPLWLDPMSSDGGRPSYAVEPIPQVASAASHPLIVQPLPAPAPAAAAPVSKAVPKSIHRNRAMMPAALSGIASQPVRLIEPPSPLAGPCPGGYLCCGDVKHFDPHHALHCCGSQAFLPTQQYCTNDEKVVDLVAASPPASPAPPPIYVQKVTLVCEGIRWEVPYPNYQCCGPSVYNVAKETCSADGLIEGRTAPPPTTTTTTEVPTRLLVCQGHRFLIPAYDFQFYACCSNDPYFWPRESCINGAVSPARPSTTTTSATPQEVQVLLVCDGVQHWIPATERMFYGCCGQDLYDLRTDVCRPPIAPSGNNNSSSPGSNCPSGYICCEDYPPVLNSNNVLQCCPGIGPYDPKTSVCPTSRRHRRK